MFIKEVKPSIIKDSRGEKTIQVEIKTYTGKFKASAPSGKSKGKHEVSSYNHRGIGWSLRMLKAFAKILQHKNFMIKKFEGLKELHGLIKKFEQKYGRFGGNATYALETCFLKAAAKENRKELWEFIKGDSNRPKMPMPICNCIGGGLHSKGKRPDFQEFVLIPKEKTFSHAVTVGFHAYEYAKKLLKKQEKKWVIRRNDEKAWMAGSTNEEVLEILFQIGKKFKLRIGLDIAASSFFERNYYRYKNKELLRDRQEQIEYIERLIEKYNLFYVEDPIREDDFSGFAELLSLEKKELRKKETTKGKKKKKGREVLITGDDLTVTNLLRLRRADRTKAINAMIIKPNQIGCLLEVAKVVQFCKDNDIKTIFSHRSGETLDNALADYAVGFGADFIKTGIFGQERLIKLGRVMEIERKLRD